VREQGLQFSVGLDLYEYVREAILNTREQDWAPAITQQGEEREGAAVCELKDLDLSSWPPGTRAICRRERPHPGGQLKFTDVNGFRFQVFITDQDDADLAQLETRHRGHARVEDRIRCGKDTGLRNLPFHDFAQNQVWLEICSLAADLIAWTQRLALTGKHRLAEPKRLRQRLFSVAGRLVRSGRRHVLKIANDWPWAGQITRAHARLAALIGT